MNKQIKKYRAIVRTSGTNIIMDHEYGDIVDTKEEDVVMYLNRCGINIDGYVGNTIFLTEDFETRIK